MIDTDKYEDAKKMVQDAGLIDENDGHPDIHYRKIANLLAEVERLREENKRMKQLALEAYETPMNTGKDKCRIIELLSELIE